METQKERKALRNSTSKAKRKDPKRNFLSKEDSSSSNEDSDSKEEANERVLFMARNNKHKVSNNEEEGLNIE